MPLLETLRDSEWQPVSRIAAAGWLLFYGGFIIYALADHSGFLIIDHVNLVVHEGGHLLFGWVGAKASLWGGTLLQWLVPGLLAAYFLVQRHTTGFVFCGFMLFENLLYTATYMADARAQTLPLVSVGDTDNPHDWNAIFSTCGVLEHDAQIAVAVRILGWAGMLVVVAWFARRAFVDWRADPA